MKKAAFLALILSAVLPSAARAGHFEFDYRGLAGAYYGLNETKKLNNADNLANRWVTRVDASFYADYVFSREHRLGLHASTTAIFKAHDRSRRNGEWRFFPYLKDESPLGSLSLGYVYNVAYQLHKGAEDITFLGVEATNLTYFLGNPNWKNSTKAVGFATPKSTAILNDGRAAKVSYTSPWLKNTRLGFSYTPDNANRRGMVSRYNDYEKTMDGYVAAAQNKWQLSRGELYTSAGYGIFNRTDKEASFGVTWVYGSFNAAAGYKKAYVDGRKNPLSAASRPPHLPAYFDNYRESQAWNISAGYDFGRYKTNLAYFRAEADNTRHREYFWLWSHLYELDKHWQIIVVASHLDAKGASAAGSDNNDGYSLIGGLALKF